MPEGPSIIILKEEAEKFTGKKIIDVDGNTKTIDKSLLLRKKIKAFRSWGKHFLIEFDKFSIRIHFLLFGSYAVDVPKDRPARLSLRFSNGSLHFYACSVRLLQSDLDEMYDWSGDVMNDRWDPDLAKSKIRAIPQAMICDTLLSQEIFAGVGNIIKNEVLFRTRVHPESLNGKISGYKINRIIREARNYSFEFLEWKKQYVLRKHWLVHTKKVCPRCGGPITLKHTGKNPRRSFFCERDQPLYH